MELPNEAGTPGKWWAFMLRNWRQSDWLSSFTLIGIGLIVVIHLACFAAVVFSRTYYGEAFNPVVFAQFVEAKKTGMWDPLAPAAVQPPAAPPPTPTILTEADSTPKPAPDDSTNNWAVLTEEERQLVRARKVQLAQNSMREAERRWLLGQQRDALDLLHQAMEDVPDHPPLVRMMAEFYQETGDLSKSGFFWEKVKLLSEEQSADWKAASEAIAKLELLARTPAGASLGGHKPIGAGRLKVVRVEEERLPLEDLYDFNLRLRITLSANLTETVVDPRETKVEILFFDQYETAGGTVLAVRTHSETKRPDRAWPSRQNATLAVQYSLPQGYWRKKLNSYGKSYDFCGYVVRVYYRGEFQDAAWSRESLLPQIRPAS